MRSKALKFLLWATAAEALAVGVGLVISKKMIRGDEQSDDFQVAAIFGGKSFHSTAGALTTGKAVASMGGIDLDLRGATLDPAGATLDLKATMGGISVLVPEGWMVDVEAHNRAGGSDVKVTPPSRLPIDSPRLRIKAATLMGGVAVAARPVREPATA